MADFNIDDFKKTWQQNPSEPRYDDTDIEDMLNKSSRNYVKYILWISIAEFVVILLAGIYYTTFSDEKQSLLNVLQRIGVQDSPNFEQQLHELYFGLKVFSLALTALFVILFYQNYRKINIESNLKKLILQIIRFKKTVQLFIIVNISLLILFSMIMVVFIISILNDQEIVLNNATITGFVVGFLVTILLAAAIMWVYYRIVYGVILKKLGKNLKQLQNIEEEN